MQWGRGRPADRRVRRDCFKCRAHRALLNCAVGVAVAAGLVVAGGKSVAGHQIGHYPSYYPDEIRIDVADPEAAGKGLLDATLHAYVGAAPNLRGPVPAAVKTATSLGSFLVLSFNGSSARFAAAGARCATTREILAALRDETAAGFVFHPYPVTPYHPDYLHHVDLIEAAKAALDGKPSPAGALTVGARGALAETMVRARWTLAAEGADVIIEVVPLEDLLAADNVQFGGWPGPPWLREGWFHAHRLLAPTLAAARRDAVDDAFERLLRGEALDLAERADLERRLVSALTGDCARVVAGYVPRREFFTGIYPDGIENVAYDSLDGLNAPIFARTAKLKDYPWNGKLQLAVRDGPGAAWNPVGGFTDAMGRLIWSAVGDPALIAFPFNASFMPNRVQSDVSRTIGQSGGIRVPADALRPQPESGVFAPVGARAFSSARVVYEALASPFEDGTQMAMADVLYPFAFVYRWGAGAAGSVAHEPRLKPVLATLQERLVGIRPVRVDRSTHAVAEGLNVVQTTLVLEAYLRAAPGDERQVAALATPWSTVPWHLLVLMEEAVIRGYAAFSEQEAARRQLPWLDLVRDPVLRAKLHDIAAQFEREGYRPEALKDLVDADEARARWRSLRTFAEKSGHFLVANGPYRLKRWSPQSVALEAVREMTYPLGFGTFDRFVNPPRAVIETAALSRDEVTVRASVEMALKAGREYRMTKEPLTHTVSRGVQGLLVVSRYLLIGPDGKVLKLDKMQWMDNNDFAIKLSDRLPEGRYKIVLAVFVDGNAVEPSFHMLPFRIGAAGSPD
jgi:hypothetical protein